MVNVDNKSKYKKVDAKLAEASRLISRINTQRVADSKKRARRVRTIANNKEANVRNTLARLQNQNVAIYNRSSRTRLSAKSKRAIKKAISDINKYRKVNFILAYSFAMANYMLSIYKVIVSMLMIVASLGASAIASTILPLLGTALTGVVFSSISVMLNMFLFIMQGFLTGYVSYFVWKNSSFMRRKFLRRFAFISMPILTIFPIPIPWDVMAIYILQRNLKKRAKKGERVLKKYNISY